MEILGKLVPLSTLVLIGLIGILMAVCANREIQSRRAGGHADLKAVIVSLGVLGTFIGIFLGLWNFDTTNIEGSVPALLEGLQLAFVTSIMGMTVSVGLAFNERTDSASFADEAASLASINEKLSHAETIAENTEKTVEQIQNFRMEIRDEQLKSRVFIEEQFTKTNDSLDKAVEKLAEGATAEIISALEVVISDFNDNLQEQFGENFKELNEAVRRLLDWQENYKNQVERSTQHLEAIMESMKESKTTLSEIADRNKDVLDVHASLHSVLEQQNEQLKVAGIQLDGQEQLINRIKDASGQLVESLSLMADRTQSLTENVEKSLSTQSESLSKLIGEIEEKLPKSLSTLDENLAGLTERFAKDYKGFLDNYQTLVASSRVS